MEFVFVVSGFSMIFYLFIMSYLKWLSNIVRFCHSILYYIILYWIKRIFGICLMRTQNVARKQSKWSLLFGVLAFRYLSILIQMYTENVRCGLVIYRSWLVAEQFELLVSYESSQHPSIQRIWFALARKLYTFPWILCSVFGIFSLVNETSNAQSNHFPKRAAAAAAEAKKRQINTKQKEIQSAPQSFSLTIVQKSRFFFLCENDGAPIRLLCSVLLMSAYIDFRAISRSWKSWTSARTTNVLIQRLPVHVFSLSICCCRCFRGVVFFMCRFLPLLLPFFSSFTDPHKYIDSVSLIEKSSIKRLR